MRKKAIILDLDNTIYPVSSIGDRLFKSLLQLISERGEYKGDFEAIKAGIFSRPFQSVADEFSFSDSLKSDSIRLLKDLTYKEAIEPFADYKILSRFPCKKFLVTTGFPAMQQSKISMLGIENDFEKIVVVDPGTSELNKTDIFRNLMDEYNYLAEDVIIVGDDLNSEIRAGVELGLETVLYDYKSEYQKMAGQNAITNFAELEPYL